RGFQIHRHAGEAFELDPVGAGRLHAAGELVEAEDDGPLHPADPAGHLGQARIEAVTIEVRARLGELVDQQLNGAPCVGPADRRRRQSAAPVQNIWVWYPDGGLLLPGTWRG